MFVVLFVVILGVLVLVHEFGHFLAAKKAKVKVEEFGVGIPPRVWGKQFGETLWSLNVLPIGGFVKLFGEEGEERQDPQSFSSKSSGVRAMILVAGVTMNFLLAWLLFSVGFTIGFPQSISESEADAVQNRTVHISQVFPDSPASQIDLQSGDKIMKFRRPAQEGEVIIEEGKGTIITGEVYLGEETIVENSEDVKNFLINNRGKRVIVFIQRGVSTIQKDFVVPLDRSQEQGILGVSLVEVGLVSYPWYRSIWEGLVTTVKLSGAIIEGLATAFIDFVSKQRVSVDVAGPVGIALLSREAMALGVPFLIQFVALISLHLAILNILPFPALDGGRLLFVVVEGLKGSPVDKKIERAIHAAGFALLLVLIILITIRDIGKFF